MTMRGIQVVSRPGPLIVVTLKVCRLLRFSMVLGEEKELLGEEKELLGNEIAVEEVIYVFS